MPEQIADGLQRDALAQQVGGNRVAQTMDAAKGDRQAAARDARAKDIAGGLPFDGDDRRHPRQEEFPPGPRRPPLPQVGQERPGHRRGQGQVQRGAISINMA